MLKNLRLRDVGPAPSFDIDFSKRLNVFTGDNGLGKTFILDIAWWAYTASWAGLPASPRRGEGSKPRIEFQLTEPASPGKEARSSSFDLAVRRMVAPGARSVARESGHLRSG